MRSIGNAARAVVWIVLVGFVLSGCGSVAMKSHFGVRPDEPGPIVGKDETSCDEYKHYVVYAQDLREAYHSRATQNRWWIYVAAILGLATIAATGGLAAIPAASTGTLALLTISGGFAAGTFATMDNSTLAYIYTTAANGVDAAITESSAKLSNANRYGDPGNCGAALIDLQEKVSATRVQIEEDRTNSARAALKRALDEQQKVQALASQFAEPASVGPNAAITKVEAPALIKKDNTTVTLTVSDVRFGNIAPDDVKAEINVGAKISTNAPSKVNDTEWKVTFEAKIEKPGLDTEYNPVLVVGKGGRRVSNKSGTKLQYPPAVITDITSETAIKEGADVKLTVDNLPALGNVSKDDMKNLNVIVSTGAKKSDPLPVTAISKDSVKFKAPARLDDTVKEYDVLLKVLKLEVKSDKKLTYP